jgi:pilus assembly protein CpaB
MNAVRIAILAAAALAAVAVAFFVRQAMTSEIPQTVRVEARPDLRILAARQDLVIGQQVSANDLYWQAWPEEATGPGYIIENRGQSAADFAGAIVRSAISQGEPITGRRLVQAGDAGFMSAILTPGMRAVAVPISPETAAGGFILPNSRVDVIVSYEQENENGRSTRRNFVAQTLVENARVLAIDGTFGEAEENVLGDTATLELTPDQARAVTLAVARGEIALVLRSLSDGNGGPQLVASGNAPEAAMSQLNADDNVSRSVTIVRYGHARQVALADGN